MTREMALPLFDHLSDVVAQISGAARIFVFLDYDGTLAPIVSDPIEAVMSEETRSSLIRLSRKPRVFVAIISGRSLTDLRQRVGLDGLTYAGNHGLEIRGPGLDFIEPSAAKRGKELQELARDLEIRLQQIPGTRVENKGLSVSVHYRSVLDAQLPHVRRIVGEGVSFAGDLFYVSQGLSVFDIRPLVNWNKGAAALWIMESSGSYGAIPVCLGDDATDEDAFNALSTGITVKVGGATETCARYRLEYQEGVGEFLSWLADFEEGVPK